MKDYLRENNHPFSNVKWAPTYNRAETIESIELMISREIPVIISIDTTFNNLSSVNLYYNNPDDDVNDYMRAITKNFYFNGADSTVTSHYMTIIGYVKYFEDGSIYPEYIFKVVSWGKIYYIRYEDFDKGISISQNILEIS